MVNEVKKGEIVIDNTENKFDEKNLAFAVFIRRIPLVVQVTGVDAPFL